MEQAQKRRLLKISIIIFALILIVAGGFLGKYYYDAFREKNDFSKLARLSEENGQGMERSYAVLKENNADFAGWLQIEGTNIDYPVMYTPNDPEYYLHRSFKKTYSRSGVPFIDSQCTLESNNLVIHGHNMKNGTMFSDLLKYADPQFAAEHPYIIWSTLEEESTYQIISAFYTKIYAPEIQNVFRYYNYFGQLDKAKMREYLANIKAAALYPTDIAADTDDMLLTLSTCAYQTEDGRFVLVAKKVAAKAADDVTAQ